MYKKWWLILFLCIGWVALNGCRRRYYRATHAPRRIIRMWRNHEGCHFKRVIYPCYSHRGNLKIQYVRCPDGRRWKRKWIHPDNRCRRRRYIRRQRELIP